MATMDLLAFAGELSSTVGDGDLILAGRLAPGLSFAEAGAVSGRVLPLMIRLIAANQTEQWEAAYYTYVVDGGERRLSIVGAPVSSSAGGAKVSWSAGYKQVVAAHPSWLPVTDDRLTIIGAADWTQRGRFNLDAVPPGQTPVVFWPGQDVDLGAVPFLAGLRNRLINGSFDVAQRGGSVVIVGGSPGYTLDQWRVSAASGLTCTATREAHPIGTARSRFFGQFAFTGTGSAGSFVSQRIERVDTLAGRQVTVAFGIKASSAQGVNVVLRQNFGAGGSPSASVDTAVATVSAGTGWTRYKRRITLPSVAGKTLGTARDFLELMFVVTQPNGQTISLDRVCLVDGDATREEDLWEERHVAVDWLLCRRRYWQGAPTSGWSLSYAQAAGSGWAGPSASFGLPMQATPSGSIISPPTYLNCTDGGLNTDVNGWSHLLNPSGAGHYRAIGGIYAMSTEL